MAFNQTIAELAMATYGRALANSGMEYYDKLLVTQVKTEDDIRNEFMSNTEAAIRYPATQSNEDTVKQIFNNVLGRDPASQTGLDFYAGLLSDATWTQSDLLKVVLLDARGASGADKEYLDTQIELARSAYDSELQTSSLSNTNYGLSISSTSTSLGAQSLFSGDYWDSSLNTISYGFNTTIPSSYYEYADSQALTEGWIELNFEQKSVVRNVMEEVNKLLGINLEEDVNPIIQLNIVNTQEGVSGFSFLPGTSFDYDGDMFLSDGFNNDQSYYGLDVGQAGYATVAHELGHALGLEHTFEGNVVLADDLDDLNHSMMSYTIKDGYVPEFTVTNSGIEMQAKAIFPDLYSLYDIEALQNVYGVNTQTNTGDDIYSLNFSDYKIQTIWDAGGNDTIDLATTSGDTELDLRAGSINSVDMHSLSEIITMSQQEVNNTRWNSWISSQVRSMYEESQLYTGKNNLSIAKGVVIENITTGTGSDTITDNEVNNTIITLSGDDKIYLGNGGYDYVDGGLGNDTIYLNLSSSQIDINELSNGNYTLTADTFGVEFTGIERLSLSNGTYAVEALI